MVIVLKPGETLDVYFTNKDGDVIDDSGAVFYYDADGNVSVLTKEGLIHEEQLVNEALRTTEQT